MNKYDVLGYEENLDDQDIDPDPDFRAVLKLLNEKFPIRTVSSCQGHAPGEQYEDVQETMDAYVTLYGKPTGLAKAVSWLCRAPHFSSAKIESPKALIQFRESVRGKWSEVLVWLQTK